MEVLDGNGDGRSTFDTTGSHVYESVDEPRVKNEADGQILESR